MEKIRKKAVLTLNKLRNRFPFLDIKFFSQQEDGFTDYYIVIDNENFVNSDEFLKFLITIHNTLEDRFIHVFADKNQFKNTEYRYPVNLGNYLNNEFIFKCEMIPGHKLINTPDYLKTKLIYSTRLNYSVDSGNELELAA